MEVSTQFNIQQAFVTTSEDTVKIWKTIENKGMLVKATVNCSDGLIRNFQDSEMLAQYENPPRASITSLEIAGYCHKPYATATVTLGSGRFLSSPVSVSIRGEEDLVASMRTTLTDTLDGMRPWYSRIATLDMLSVWLFIFMILVWLALTMGLLTLNMQPTPVISFKKALPILIISGAEVGLFYAVIRGVNWLLKYIFPVTTFAIGQGIRRHHHYEQIRWVVIVGFLVSVVASIFVTILPTA